MKKLMSLIPNRLALVIGLTILPTIMKAEEVVYNYRLCDDSFESNGIKAFFIGIGLFFVEFVIVPAIIIALICLGIRTIRGFFNI